ncbi:TRAP transporter small permease subunit [Salinicola sp. MIT1003]|uniref:TRAP transporter small permease subunit n=1 Tax=Salinicola sp. MIT1003 TaxID=1882734 RepID=UPI0008DD4B5E|nr:TRAP transporter small permease subunit [Salinicola sp. MIT1003]OHZ02709.1 hypothetical protein BC443_13375 [Salinicola sp. MIT1003]
MHRIERFSALYARFLYFSGLAAGAVVFLMMVLIVVNILARFLFNSPIAGTLEITESLLTLLIFLAIGLTQQEKKHIQVTLLFDRFGLRTRKGFRVLTYAIGFMFLVWCSTAAWEFFFQSWRIGEQEWGSIRYPLYPVKFIVFVGLFLLAIQFFFDTLLAVMTPASDASPDSRREG